MSSDTKSPAEKLAAYLANAKQTTVFTGAGISTESGISDYRSKGGLWDRFQPVTYQEFLADEEKRRQYWMQKKELYECFVTARPNLGHQAIARLDKKGRLAGVITQNIDELHQMAGLDPEKIAELHGTNRRTVCLECAHTVTWLVTYQRLLKGEDIPRCQRCNGLLKPATVSFGQRLDPHVLMKAQHWVEQCDLLLAVGSTLVVEPAASLPLLARQRGAKLVIINLSETPLDTVADLVIREVAGKILHQAVELLHSGMQATS